MRLKGLINMLGITLGALITALGLILFLIPNKIAAGGVSGLATVIFYVLNLPVGLTMLVINIPLFLISLRQLGVRFGIKTLFGTVMLSVFTDGLNPLFTPLTSDPLLAAIYGGISTGLGLGLVFKFGATTGGTDLAAQLIHKYIKVSVGKGLLLIDAMVVILAGIVFDVELALYALIALFATTKMIDLVQEGLGYVKAALIISDKSEELGRVIITKLDRGATALHGRGLYTGKDRDVILVVLSRTEVAKIKGMVQAVDPKAFVIVTNVNEALGEGFKDMSHEVI
ncbi:YitT family protein [Metallumcola ferriviriculae]|uniref:YitT family protein n=1 Tax=Metallumcola ferriviriculae TaxID=3039180 RepID=A0AAU0UHY3_9FIRM|nr:YitT family protein [Desulfitibacteraceae bacterium MK1]